MRTCTLLPVLHDGCMRLQLELYSVCALRSSNGQPQVWPPAGGLPDIRRRAEALQRKFNEESKAVKLELVLFTDALMHLMRISRLFAMDRGSALLVGVGGSGKQSLSRLAAYIAGAELGCRLGSSRRCLHYNTWQPVPARAQAAACAWRAVVCPWQQCPVGMSRVMRLGA